MKSYYGLVINNGAKQMTAQEIRKAIRELKREMKANNIPVRSCFNGGHTSESMRCNQQLFALKTQLEKGISK